MKPVLASVVVLAALSSSTTAYVTNLKTSWDDYAYVSPLKIPEVLDMTTGGHLDLQIATGSHNWTSDGAYNGTIYGYGLTNSSVTFPGPTIKVAKGVPITVTYYNELSSPHLLDENWDESLTMMESGCYPYCGVPVVTHIHGLEGPAKWDGLPTRSIYKNQSGDFTYYNNQSASTKLYHDHSNGLTRLNVWAGLSGAYIIEDAEMDASLNLDIETDVPLIFNDRLISNSGKLMYTDYPGCDAAATDSWVPESYGNVNLVNGVVMPYLEIPNSKVRFRLINSANARHYNFSIPFADLCVLVAKDSGYVQKTESVDDFVMIFPYERVELVCDFSNAADSTTYDLIDYPDQDQNTIYDTRVMQFRVSAALKTSTMNYGEIPSTLVKYKSLKTLFEETGGKDRLITLGEVDNSVTQCPEKSLINYRNQQINMSTTMGRLACTKGKVERWHFRNPTDDPHPFHWHLVNVQCGDTEDEIDTNSLKDVHRIPNAGDRASDTVTQVCYVACVPDQFLIEDSTVGATEYNFNTTDPYVAHCHILEHEENAMMSWFQITDTDDDATNDDGSSTSSNKITSDVVWTAMGMSVLGGFATTLSVLVISVERLKFLADPRSLSIAFALSAGVMVFIAFADLFTEATNYYTAAYTTGGSADPEAYETGGASSATGTCDDTCSGKAWLTTVGVFFVGMLVIIFVEYIVHEVFANKDGQGNAHGIEMEDGIEKNILSPANNASPSVNGHSLVVESPAPANENADLMDENSSHKEEYRRSGILTGIAIAIHNFPEGLALFVSSLSGVRAGIVLSIGIILHNLPEGVAVAAPVYYATGSRLEAFKWTALSGIAQPLGAFCGWVAVSGGMSYALQATLYALVAGMLVCITIKELLPGAYRFDPKGQYFVLSFSIGILIIAGSLVALHFAGSS